MSEAPTHLRSVPHLTGTTGQRIRAARSFRLLKQDEMLEVMRSIDPMLTPSSLKTYSGWERDKKSPTVDEIRLVARATGFPAEDFVADDDAPAPGPSGPGAAVYPPWDSNPEPADSRPRLRAA